MKSKISVLFMIMFLVLSFSVCQAAIYVCQTNGNNQNPGTKDSPVKEIDRAINLVEAGGEIFIAGGTYTGTFGVGYMESDKPFVTSPGV